MSLPIKETISSVPPLGPELQLLWCLRPYRMVWRLFSTHLQLSERDIQRAAATLKKMGLLEKQRTATWDSYRTAYGVSSKSVALYRLTRQGSQAQAELHAQYALGGGCE